MKALHASKFPSLLLALFIQLAPVCKVIQSSPRLASSPFAFFCQLVGAASAVLGAVHAVSGATVVRFTSTNNATGTNGVAFRFRITDNGKNPPDDGTWIDASNQPPGITIDGQAPGVTLDSKPNIGGNPNPNFGVLAGTPTQIGVWIVHLTAGYEDLRAVPTNLTITIVGKPVVTTSLTNQTVTAGATVNFSLIATGLPPPVYSWRFTSSTITNDLAGATNATLSLANVQTTNTGTYTVIATNLYGAVTNAATLTVNPAGVPATITSPLTNQTVFQGATVTLGIVASGTPAPAFRWQFNSTNIAGATNSSLSLTNVQPTNAGAYTVFATNLNGGTNSSATLTVNPPPVITNHPLGQIALVGSNVTFTAGATGVGLAFQWRFNTSSNLPGATAATLTLTNVAPAHSGLYSVVVTNGAGGVASTNAQLLVVPPPGPASAPTIAPLAVSGGQSTLAFTTLPGYRYLVQTNADMSTTNWMTLSNIPPAFTSLSIHLPQDVTNAPRLFYRVTVLGN